MPLLIIKKHIPYCLLRDITNYNIQDNAGYTALHLAVLFHNERDFRLHDIIQTFRQYTNETLQDQWGYTAYELAKKIKKHHLLENNS